MTPDPPVLRVRALSAEYGARRALEGIDLRVDAGELVAIAGEPGAGKTTLVRCLAGDLVPAHGEILIDDLPVSTASGASGVGVVWQQLELCENLDVAGNLLLGQETSKLMLSESRFHASAASVLHELGIPIADTTQLVGALPAGQRQLLALARALSGRPLILLLDEPTAALAGAETAQLEQIITRVRGEGVAVLLAGGDVEQMFRIAGRIVVLRQGHVVAELDPQATHPDDVAALMSGHQVDSSARRQLSRLHGLADSLLSADPSSSLSLILSALGAALATERVAIHVAHDGSLLCAASLGFEPGQIAAWSRLPIGAEGGPIGHAAREEDLVVQELRASTWLPFRQLSSSAKVASAWSFPVVGPAGLSGVITVFRSQPGVPDRDQLDLLTLYAGWAAGAVERDRLLDQATARNRVLETIREMLETLAGPVAVEQGLVAALGLLRGGLQADEVALLIAPIHEQRSWRAYVGPRGTDPAAASPALRSAAEPAVGEARHDGTVRDVSASGTQPVLAVSFTAPGGPAVLLASFDNAGVSEAESALLEDAAHSVRLALEREEAALAHQAASALRRSRELQRGFLSRLSHELRTPLTAIRGYASSLMQTDVTWDGESERRFLARIAAESARLGRLVDDLLDFSAIESGVMRLQADWCELPLVIGAAVSCLPPEWSEAVSIDCDPDLPTVWADHDRLEQVFVNLLSNALRHNPPGTHVKVGSRLAGADEVEITVADDGPGFPPALLAAPFEPARRQRSHSAGAGLGLSIARGIVEAHGGAIALVAPAQGTVFRIRLPVEAAADRTAAAAPDPGEATLLSERECEPAPVSAGEGERA